METEGTVIEQPADDMTDLGSDLVAAFDEYEETGETNELDQQSVDDPDTGVDGESPEQSVDDADGDDADIQELDEETNDNNNDGLQQTAPDHWSQEDKDRFNALNDLGDEGKQAQDFLLGRHKAMEADYTRKTQEIADFKKTWQPLEEAIEPYAQGLTEAGVTPTQYFYNLGKADEFLKNNPTEGIKWVAEQYGIDLAQFSGQQTESSQELAALRKELNDLKTGINNEKQ